MTMDVANDMPIRLQDRGSVDEACGASLIDRRKLDSKLTGRLVPQDKSGRLVWQGRTEVVEDRSEATTRDHPATQVRPGRPCRTIWEIGVERTRDGHIERKPWSAKDEHYAVPADRESVSGAAFTQRIKRRRPPAGRDRITGNGGEQRRRRRIVSEHRHCPAAAATSVATVIA